MIVDTAQTVEEEVLRKQLKVKNKINLLLLIGLTGSLVTNSIYANNKYANVDSNRYNTTQLGVPIVANLGIDKTIDVVIDESFDDEQKEYITTAIEELDIDLTGVSYNIMLNSDKKSKKCINILKKDCNPADKSALAETFLKHNDFYGNIVYPVNIQVYTKSLERGYGDLNVYNDYFSAVIKHEMLHTLGFKDVYDKKYFNKTIMYGELSYQTRLFDLSQEDIDMVNSVYKPKAGEKIVDVRVNEPVYIAPETEEEEESL